MNLKKNLLKFLSGSNPVLNKMATCSQSCIQVNFLRSLHLSKKNEPYLGEHLYILEYRM